MTITIDAFPRIVLTGGPCSGKSTILQQLRRDFAERVQFVPEMATLVMEQLGISAPPSGNPQAMLEFQTTIARAQRVFEDGAVLHARRTGKMTIVCDRGEVDGGAYLDGGIPTLEAVSGLSIGMLYRRYAKVIYLAVPPRSVYSANRAGNPSRHESYEQAMQLGKATLDMWNGHPDLVVVHNYENMDDKTAVVTGHVAAFLGMDTAIAAPDA